MATNKLTEVAGLVAQAVMGATIKDKDGNDKIIKPDGNANYLDLRDIVAGSSGTGGGDNPENPDNPSAGADYYAGSLADGEITERYLLYQRDESVAEQTGSQTVKLLRDVGSKFNMAGDGATFLIHLQKTAMTKGAKGAVTDIELNYDTKNVAKNGYFTTTSPYPIYIKASDLGTKKTLSIPINGIGESLSGKNVKAPQLNVIFNGDGTMTFESVTGYDNDGDSAGATGANYEVVVDVIATFSAQPAVAQLPASIVYFSGSINRGQDIVLVGPSDFYENSMDGIEITMEDYIHFDNKHRLPITALGGLKTTYRISKEQLILGNKSPIPMDSMIDIIEEPKSGFSTGNNNLPIASLQGLTPHWQTGDTNYLFYRGYLDPTISINKNSIKLNLAILMEGKVSGTGSPLKWGNPTSYTWNILKVTPYKD
ncbi:hypothetical protein JMJ99_06720 [Companilactobacillus zhachilii]|uniref:hypothetical protein n=1 Tax=Companilactobacillus zhachilii TaxID=2304606 RepID=UPI0019235E19|nr:hypothetical protein [Companilactobacillus zhachilii]MBL3531059.1 hypothetical protein [Companilactobacillus zhachilii]